MARLSRLLLLFLSLTLLAACDPEPAAEPGPTAVGSLLGPEGGEGFRQAMLPGEIRLPADHGPHPEYRSEWWYFTGNLSSPEGNDFGFQLTFFRFALVPDAPARSSAWATSQIYMGHFAVTDLAGGRHEVSERFARAAAGLAGARAEPFEVWLDDWSARSEGTAFLPLRLAARDSATNTQLELRVEEGKPPVLQGRNGLSAKGANPGNASWYYSYTRMPAAGTLQWQGQAWELEGDVWLDREWSTSSLDAGVVGWDWFGLQLADGRDLMLYSLRQRDGSPAPQSAGALIETDGTSRYLDADSFGLTPLEDWQSPASGTRWPVRWRLEVPSAALDLEVFTPVPDQEQDLSVRYWEGAVQVLDRESRAARGRGYMELTGYRPPSAKSSP